jgi:DNA-binding transcriptional regulator YhcF (GntR family)
MLLDVDTGSAVPPYEQIRSQIAELAGTPDLPAGARLPTIRQLAGDLGLAPGTVARAYRELESQGVVVSRVRHGTTIAPRQKVSAARSRRELHAAARSFARTAQALGFSAKDAAGALAQEFAEAD